MDKKQQKIKQAIQLTEAQKNGTSAWVIMGKLDELEDKIENIPVVDLHNIEDTLSSLTNKVNEEIIYELEII
jgi:cell fate (sporulation/competence/biofilm development) regulator YmcA (YheA/YmcA/DUF963 family)